MFEKRNSKIQSIERDNKYKKETLEKKRKKKDEEISIFYSDNVIFGVIKCRNVKNERGWEIQNFTVILMKLNTYK